MRHWPLFCEEMGHENKALKLAVKTAPEWPSATKSACADSQDLAHAISTPRTGLAAAFIPRSRTTPPLARCRSHTWHDTSTWTILYLWK